VIYFLDTSALVKRYVAERGSDQVRRLFRRRPEIAVSRMTEAEAYAAIARAARSRIIDDAVRDAIFDRIAADMSVAKVVEIRRPLVESVRTLVSRWALRGYDAVQLACALRVRTEGATVDLWCSDRTLVAAARGEGMRATLV
jgi:predicted nucleic acid-binding protein